MSEQLQLRRGVYSSGVNAFTGAQGETVVDTTFNRLYVNDGFTVGGWAAGREQKTAVPDTAYSVLVTDRVVGYSTLTAARAVTLPAAANWPPGALLTVADESGNCSTTKTITLNRSGSDTINGQTSIAINVPFAYVTLEANPTANTWTVLGSFLAATAPNGANMQFAVIESWVSNMLGATVTGPSIPANCIVFSVGARVGTLITASGSPTGFEVGVSGNLSQFGGSGAGIGFTVGTTNYGLIGPTAFYSATPILLTPVGGS